MMVGKAEAARGERPGDRRQLPAEFFPIVQNRPARKRDVTPPGNAAARLGEDQDLAAHRGEEGGVRLERGEFGLDGTLEEAARVPAGDERQTMTRQDRPQRL